MCIVLEYAALGDVLNKIKLHKSNAFYKIVNLFITDIIIKKLINNYLIVI